MPSEYKPVERISRDILGCRIKPGVTPGGFSHHFGAGPTSSKRPLKRKKITTEAVKAAASAALERRGVQQVYSDWAT